MNAQIMKILAAAAMAASAFAAFAAPKPEAKMHRLSTTIEKERPKLDDETPPTAKTRRRKTGLR